MLPPGPTLSLCIRLLKFRLLLQSGDIEANPGPTLTSILTLGDDLNFVYKNLINAAGNWFDLGLDLGLHPGTLQNIKDDNHRNKDCLREMIGARLKTGPPLTYYDICRSLRASTVQRNDVATAIEELCTGGAGPTESLGASMRDTVIKNEDLIYLAAYFDSSALLVAAMSLEPYEEGNVKKAEVSEGIRVAVQVCLKYWKQKKQKEATVQALLAIVRGLGKEDTATRIEEYFQKK